MTRNYLTDRGGAAAVEFALWLGLLIIPVLNVIDLGFYAFQAMQVREAAESAVQSAYSTCVATQTTSALVPAATKCAALTAQLTAAAQSTSLASSVTVSTGVTNSWEGYYCAGDTNSATTPVLSNATVSGGSTPWPLLTNATVPTPSACTNGNTAGDYIAVTVSLPFHSLFGGVSVASLLKSPITQQAWMRLQ